jgi:hypothetical protein
MQRACLRGASCPPNSLGFRVWCLPHWACDVWPVVQWFCLKRSCFYPWKWVALDHYHGAWWAWGQDVPCAYQSWGAPERSVFESLPQSCPNNLSFCAKWRVLKRAQLIWVSQVGEVRTSPVRTPVFSLLPTLAHSLEMFGPPPACCIRGVTLRRLGLSAAYVRQLSSTFRELPALSWYHLK